MALDCAMCGTHLPVCLEFAFQLFWRTPSLLMQDVSLNSWGRKAAFPKRLLNTSHSLRKIIWGTESSVCCARHHRSITALSTAAEY